ncbi:uncharacterized protein DS421_4g122580 [Arachis hypogaea]|nr:uncharacterized protein DS421_4g122580 [Arachis hypogaea]
MRVVAKAGCVRILPRAAVVLVTGCDVGVAGIHHWCSRYLVPSSTCRCGYRGGSLEPRLRLLVISVK